MIVLKYQKTDNIRFISHIDLLRHVDRIIRRGEIKVNYSHGFNPHALVYFSPPITLGVGSVAEYLTIDTDMPKDEVFARYNASVPSSLKASKVFECVKNPNLQANVCCADYVYDVDFDAYKLDDKIIIEYEKKGELVKEDIRPKIFGAINVGGKLCLRLASGSVNLRPDRLLDDINAKTGKHLTVCDIEKINQYVQKDGGVVSADNFLINN